MPDDAAPITRNETPTERADRNFDDILQELRVTQTGVQVLFSLLLTVPFSARFEQVTQLEKRVYFVALLLAAATVVFLVAPVSVHRLLFHTGEKPWVVKVSSRLAIIGLVLLSLTLTTVLMLVSEVLFHTAAAVVTAAVFAVATLTLWFVPPLLRRRSATDRAARAKPKRGR